MGGNEAGGGGGGSNKRWRVLGPGGDRKMTAQTNRQRVRHLIKRRKEGKGWERKKKGITPGQKSRGPELM